MKSPKEKSEELIADFIQMSPPNNLYSFHTQYELAKCNAEYCANVAKWSHDVNSEMHNYWTKVREEINKM